jgi:hypothetical protein
VADVVATVNSATNQIWPIFKEVYGDRIAQQANTMPFLYNEFEKSKTPFGGKYFTEPMWDEGGQAVGSYNQDEQLADAQAETYKEIQIKPRFHYATIRITGAAMAAARKNLWAFAQARESEIKAKTTWLISQLNAQCFQTGKGILGSITTPITNGAGGSFTVDVTAGQTQGTQPNWFRKGLKVDVWNSAITARRNSADTTTKGVGWQIASYNRTSNLVTIVAGQTTAGVVAGDVITYEDAQLTGAAAPMDATGKQITGLATLVDDVSEGPTTIQNVSRSTFPIFNGNRLANGGVRRPLSLKLVQQGVSVVEQLSGEPPDFIISGYGIRDQYLDLLWYDVRYAPQELKGGYTTLKYNNMDWYVDKDCQLARLYTGNRQYINKFEVQPIGILDQAGPSAERVPKFDVYEILVGGYLNMGVIRPNSWEKTLDLIEP